MIVFIILAAVFGGYAVDDRDGHRAIWVALAILFALVSVVYNREEQQR